MSSLRKSGDFRVKLIFKLKHVWMSSGWLQFMAGHTCTFVLYLFPKNWPHFKTAIKFSRRKQLDRRREMKFGIFTFEGVNKLRVVWAWICEKETGQYNWKVRFLELLWWKCFLCFNSCSILVPPCNLSPLFHLRNVSYWQVYENCGVAVILLTVSFLFSSSAIWNRTKWETDRISDLEG